MCGIVGYVGPKECASILVEGLRRLEYRGYDSAGLAIQPAPGKPVNVLRAVGKLSNLDAALRENPLKGTTGIGHTRWATHGRPRSATPTRTSPVTSRSSTTASSRTTWPCAASCPLPA